MVKRQTWILLAVFVILIGLAFFWTRYQNEQKKANSTLTPTPTQVIFTVDSATVASMMITDNATGNIVIMARDETGQWTLVEPQSEYTDVAKIESAMTQLTSLRVTSSLATSNNLAEYGLEQPAYTITLNVNDGVPMVANVGSATATSNGYYVLVPGGVPQIVSKYSLDAVLKLLTDPPLATPTSMATTPGAIATTAVSTMTLEVPASTPAPLPDAESTATIPPAVTTPASSAKSTPLAATPIETTKP